jgi:hypothetical protein
LTDCRIPTFFPMAMIKPTKGRTLFREYR